jgi:thiosulfate dehydrogenase
MIRRSSAVALSLLAATACAPQPEPVPAAGAPAVVFTESSWKAPTEADIPNDSMGASIKRGLYLLRYTPDSLPQYATSNLRCTSCHLNDGTKLQAAPLTGSHARSLPQSDRDIDLRTGQLLLHPEPGRQRPPDPEP